MKKNWLNKNVLGFGAASFLSDFSHEMATAILPSFITSIVGISNAPQFLGIISGIANSISSLAKLFAGKVSDKAVYRRPIILGGNALVGLFISLIGTAHSIAVIAFYQTLAWIGRAFVGPARDSLLSESVSSQFYGRAYGIQRAMDTFGAIAGPATAAVLVTKYNLTTIFFIAGIPALCSFLSILLLTEELPRKIHPVKSYFSEFKILPSAFKLFLLISFIFGLANFNKTLLLLRIQEFTGTTQSLVSSPVLLLYTLLNATRAVSEYCIGYISDFIDKKLIIAIVGFMLFGLIATALIHPTTNYTSLAWIFIGAGISTAAVKVVSKAYTAEVLPEQVRGTGFGLLQTATGIAELFCNIIVGFLWTHHSATFAFGYCAILSVLASIFLLHRKT